MISQSNDIEQQVLKCITPTAKEEQTLQKTIQILLKEIIKQLHQYKITITPQLVGSTAKGTYLRNDLDIDLFLVFPITTPRKTLANISRTVGYTLLADPEECYAEHPYIRGIYHGYKTEIVPCYHIESVANKLSAVDRTPLHTSYITKHLTFTQQQEVRVFKQFLHGIGCYGAEAEIEGFSGYLSELIILQYHTFQNTIDHASKWKPGITITLTPDDPPSFSTPLIIIDPVDPERNVASALSQEKFDIFVHACQQYKKTPSLQFFFPNPLKPWPLNQISEQLKNKNIIGVEFQNPGIINENLYPQLRKAARAMQEIAITYDFQIYRTCFYITKQLVGVVLFPEKNTISPTIEHTGPPVHLEKNVKEFRDKWLHHQDTIAQPYHDGKRWYVRIKRPYTNIIKLLQDQIPQLRLGKHLEPIVQNHFTIVRKPSLLREELRFFWTEQLDSKKPWER
ncbi:MAG: CCA tRNA nucleotidyltransferase [Candidatus Thermoplasmatota archaeon]|nr:CCA tRNA nucleotidyltransferase [Candidatus Thermoplasmatota archaeon]MBU1941045.1 CCA tRNA nucleotidyltransferase [Candidatus Thermoplasmatota archaeon]